MGGGGNAYTVDKVKKRRQESKSGKRGVSRVGVCGGGGGERSKTDLKKV